MRPSIRRLCLFSVAAAALASVVQVAAEKRVYAARIYLDRGTPNRAVPVFDLRVNERHSDAGGVQHISLYSPDGTFTVPFDQISEIVFNRSLGSSGDTASYDVRVVLTEGSVERSGRLDLRSLRGSVNLVPWHLLLTSRDDRGANLHRIVFGNEP